MYQVASPPTPISTTNPPPLISQGQNNNNNNNNNNQQQHEQATFSMTTNSLPSSSSSTSSLFEPPPPSFFDHQQYLTTTYSRNASLSNDDETQENLLSCSPPRFQSQSQAHTPLDQFSPSDSSDCPPPFNLNQSPSSVPLSPPPPFSDNNSLQQQQQQQLQQQQQQQHFDSLVQESRQSTQQTRNHHHRRSASFSSSSTAPLSFLQSIFVRNKPANNNNNNNISGPNNSSSNNYSNSRRYNSNNNPPQSSSSSNNNILPDSNPNPESSLSNVNNRNNNNNGSQMDNNYIGTDNQGSGSSSPPPKPVPKLPPPVPPPPRHQNSTLSSSSSASSTHDLSQLGLAQHPVSPDLLASRYGVPLCGSILDDKYLLIGTTTGLDFLPLNRPSLDKFGKPKCRRPIPLVKRTKFRQIEILSKRSNVLLAISGRNDHVRVYGLDGIRTQIDKKMKELDDKEGRLSLSKAILYEGFSRNRKSLLSATLSTNNNNSNNTQQQQTSSEQDPNPNPSARPQNNRLRRDRPMSIATSSPLRASHFENDAPQQGNTGIVNNNNTNNNRHHRHSMAFENLTSSHSVPSHLSSTSPADSIDSDGWLDIHPVPEEEVQESLEYISPISSREQQQQQQQRPTHRAPARSARMRRASNPTYPSPSPQEALSDTMHYPTTSTSNNNTNNSTNNNNNHHHNHGDGKITTSDFLRPLETIRDIVKPQAPNVERLRHRLSNISLRYENSQEDGNQSNDNNSNNNSNTISPMDDSYLENNANSSLHNNIDTSNKALPARPTRFNSIKAKKLEARAAVIDSTKESFTADLCEFLGSGPSPSNPRPISSSTTATSNNTNIHQASSYNAETDLDVDDDEAEADADDADEISQRSSRRNSVTSFRDIRLEPRPARTQGTSYRDLAAFLEEETPPQSSSSLSLPPQQTQSTNLQRSATLPSIHSHHENDQNSIELLQEESPLPSRHQSFQSNVEVTNNNNSSNSHLSIHSAPHPNSNSNFNNSDSAYFYSTPLSRTPKPRPASTRRSTILEREETKLLKEFLNMGPHEEDHHQQDQQSSSHAPFDTSDNNIQRSSEDNNRTFNHEQQPQPLQQRNKRWSALNVLRPSSTTPSIASSSNTPNNTNASPNNGSGSNRQFAPQARYSHRSEPSVTNNITPISEGNVRPRPNSASAASTSTNQHQRIASSSTSHSAPLKPQLVPDQSLVEDHTNECNARMMNAQGSSTSNQNNGHHQSRGSTSSTSSDNSSAQMPLEYVKLARTKGAHLIRAFETSKRTYLAVLCGENHERIELFTGSKNVSLSLNRTFVLPQTPKTIELHMLGDDLLDLFLVYANSIFALEPSTVRVREVGIGRNERRQARRERERHARDMAALARSRAEAAELEDSVGESNYSRQPRDTVQVNTPNLSASLSPTPSLNSNMENRHINDLDASTSTSVTITTNNSGLTTSTTTTSTSVSTATAIPTTVASMSVPSATRAGGRRTRPSQNLRPYCMFQQLRLLPPVPPSALASSLLIPPTYDSVVRSNSNNNNNNNNSNNSNSNDPAVQSDVVEEEVSNTTDNEQTVDGAQLLSPISLLLGQQAADPPGLFFVSRGRQSTGIVDSDGRSILKRPIQWRAPNNDELHEQLPHLDIYTRVEALSVNEGSNTAIVAVGPTDVQTVYIDSSEKGYSDPIEIQPLGKNSKKDNGNNNNNSFDSLRDVTFLARYKDCVFWSERVAGSVCIHSLLSKS